MSVPITWPEFEESALVVETASCEETFDTLKDRLDAEQKWTTLVGILMKRWTDAYLSGELVYVPAIVTSLQPPNRRWTGYQGMAYVFTYLLEMEGLLEPGGIRPRLCRSARLRSVSTPGTGRSYMEIALRRHVHERLVEYWMREDGVPIKQSHLPERAWDKVGAE